MTQRLRIESTAERDFFDREGCRSDGLQWAAAAAVKPYGATDRTHLAFSTAAGRRAELRRMHATHDTRRTTVETSRTDDKPTGVRVSNHARFRVQQRLGVIEQTAEHVRELLADAVPVDDDPQYPNSRAYRCGGVTIVLDDRDDVVKTVVKEVESR